MTFREARVVPCKQVMEDVQDVQDVTDILEIAEFFADVLRSCGFKKPETYIPYPSSSHHYCVAS